jgi:guanylate kinase
VTDTDQGMLLIISGPSGVGKTTITRAVERAIPGAVFSVSATTRAKTDADVEGVDYHFVTECQFDAMIAGNEFLEHAGVFGKRYGTPRAWVVEQLRRGRLVILEIDVQGAINVKRSLPGAFAMFILPPSEEELLNRLRCRKREDEEKILKRFAAARSEIETAKSCGVYDVFLVNQVLDEAIGRAVGIVKAELTRRGIASA